MRKLERLLEDKLTLVMKEDKYVLRAFSYCISLFFQQKYHNHVAV